MGGWTIVRRVNEEEEEGLGQADEGLFPTKKRRKTGTNGPLGAPFVVGTGGKRGDNNQPKQRYSDN